MIRTFCTFTLLLCGSYIFSQSPSSKILALEVLQGQVTLIDSAGSSLDTINSGDSSLAIRDYTTDLEIILTLENTSSIDHFDIELSNASNTIYSVTKSLSDNILPPNQRHKGKESYIKFRLTGITLPGGQKKIEINLQNSSDVTLATKSRYF